MKPRAVLRPAHEARGSEDPIGPALVEPRPISRPGAQRRLLAHVRVPARRPTDSRVNSARPGTRRGLARQADLGGPTRNRISRGPRRLRVLVGRVAAGVVELVEHVRVDSARTPLAVVDLGSGRAVRRSRRTGGSLRRPRRTARGARDGRFGRGTRRASRRAVSSSTIAPRNWLRDCSPRSATSRQAPSSASRGPSSHGGSGRRSPGVTNSAGNIVRHSRDPFAHRSSRRAPAPARPASRPRAGPPRAPRADPPGCPA